VPNYSTSAPHPADAHTNDSEVYSWKNEDARDDQDDKDDARQSSLRFPQCALSGLGKASTDITSDQLILDS